jgi:outer membrane protein OmpA-like peptidoglycan-associated protein
MKKKFQNTAVAFGVFLMLSGCATTSNPSDFLKQTFASDDPCSNNSRNIGIAVGAIGGTILAKVSGGSNNESLLLGAAAGSLVGGLIGADMDRRRCELSKIAKQFDLDITFNDIKIDNSITLNESNATANEITSVPKFPAVSTVSVMAVRDKEDRQDRGHFKTGSDQLTPKAQEYFGAIAEQYARNLALESEKDKTKRDEALKQYSLNRRILLVGHTDDTGSSQLNACVSSAQHLKASVFC